MSSGASVWTPDQGTWSWASDCRHSAGEMQTGIRGRQHEQHQVTWNSTHHLLFVGIGLLCGNDMSLSVWPETLSEKRLTVCVCGTEGVMMSLPLTYTRLCTCKCGQHPRLSMHKWKLNLEFDGIGSASFMTLTLTAPLNAFNSTHKHTYTPWVVFSQICGMMLLEKHGVPPAVGCIDQLDGLEQHRGWRQNHTQG